MTRPAATRRAPARAPVTHGKLDRRIYVAGWQLTETTHPPGMRLPSHVHEDPAITLVLEGAFRERYRSGPVECRPGGLLIKPAGETHSNHYDPCGARSLLIARGLGSDVTAIAEPLYREIRYFPGGLANRLAALIAVELARRKVSPRRWDRGLHEPNGVRPRRFLCSAHGTADETRMA